MVNTNKTLKSESIAFIAGYVKNEDAKENLLMKALSKQIPGITKVVFPRHKWNGFGFVYFDSNLHLESFLKRGKVMVSDNYLNIKPYFHGPELNKARESYNSRRIFIRILSKDPIDFNLHSYFSQFGSLEDAYFILDSKSFIKNKHSIVCYVLFEEQYLADYFIHLEEIVVDNCLLQIKKTEATKISTHKNPKQGKMKDFSQKVSITSQNRDTKVLKPTKERYPITLDTFHDQNIPLNLKTDQKNSIDRSLQHL
jgi:hypothetical protein